MRIKLISATIAVASLTIYGLWSSALATPTPAPPQAQTAVISFANPAGVPIATDQSLWRVEATNPAGNQCAGGRTPLFFYNTSSQTEYIDGFAAVANSNPVAVPASGSYEIGMSYPGQTDNQDGLFRVSAADGQTSLYITESAVTYECRVTATIVQSPLLAGNKPLPLSGVVRTPQTNSSAPVLNAGDWEVSLASCDLTLGPFFSFTNTSDKTEQIQGGPFATPTSVMAGSTVNLGTGWPTPSNPLGVIHVTSGNVQTDTYITGELIGFSECWGTANTTLVTG